jgi:hypothetical protein
MIEQVLNNFKTELNNEMKLSIQNVYGEWSKEPIDTGEMLRTVNLVNAEINIPEVKINITIDTTEYAKYVRFPKTSKNSNYKYGPRDFVNSAMQRPNIVELRNKLINEMIKKNLEISDSGLKLKTIKIDI